MDGVFMGKIIKMISTLAVAVSLFLVGVLITDRHYLRNEVIRLRVVAASDADSDQIMKRKVKDEINIYLQKNMNAITSADAARSYLRDSLKELKSVADTVLMAEGSDHRAKVYLVREMADKRDYDTFSLPAGRYETLHIDIGPAQGQNWWCVVFPSLCMPETVEAFAETAAASGVSTGLTRTLMGDGPVRVRFFLLDLLGKAEKFFDFS